MWQGESVFYQEQALLSLVEAGYRIWPWSWVSAVCGTEGCLQPDHLNLETPRNLKYPDGQCVYCGLRAQSKDHIVPTSITGQSTRRYVLTVPACIQCNSAIGDTPVYSIDGRRAVAQAHLRKRFKGVLRRPEYTDEEINEFEGRLKQAILMGVDEKRQVEARLAWPDDPHFDLRWLQKSGIENPYVSGLLRPSDAS